MNTPFPFELMLVFSFLSALLIFGIILRAKIAVLQKFLFPGCLVGGVCGLVLLQTGIVNISSNLLETVAYHFFNLSFISVGLTGNDERIKSQKGKGLLRGPAWMALVQGLTFPMQAALSGTIVLCLGAAGYELFPTFGFLVPLGFNEGPGQALSIGKAWEGLGFANGATIGLSFAAAGYFFAFFVGVPLVNKGIRKGVATFGTNTLTRDFLVGVRARDQKTKSAGSLAFHSGNAESMAFQTALVGIVYGLTWGLVCFLESFLPPDAGTILWGFFFFFGLGVAFIVRSVMKTARLDYLCDPGLQRRITGWSIDYLIVATITAIQLKIVWDYLLPIGIISIANGILTTMIVIYLGRRLDFFQLERSAAIFGTVTGTVSCGLLLLRMVDPEFKTPVAFEVAAMNILVLPIVGGCTVLVNAPLWWGWSVWFTVLIFMCVFVVCLSLLKLMGFLSKVQKNA